MRLLYRPGAAMILVLGMVFAFVLSIPTSAFAAKWILQNPLPRYESLFSVHFTDASTGWAVGSEGTIVKTVDGGATWTAQTSGTTRWLYSVHFTDANTGWAVGYLGTILRTVDGGATWITQTSGRWNTLVSLHFTDANTGWAVGYYGTVLKTVDGGATWVAQTSGTTSNLISVYFTDANTGCAVGNGGTILRTLDGGATWTAQTSGTTSNLTSVYFTDANTGCAVGLGGTILKTLDCGATWTAQTSGTTNDLWSVHFTDANTGWVVGNFGTILRTLDGGATWTAQTSGTRNLLYSVHFTDVNAGWAVGHSGTILRTVNGGAVATHTLNYTAGAGGFVEGSVTQTIEHGSDGLIVFAYPTAGYRFVKWSDGSTANARIDTNITGDLSVFAIFASDAPVVTDAVWSNPIAYQLKSLLSTKFTCTLDEAATGKLEILNGSGVVVKTVYNGPMAAGANALPAWNGLDAAGKRLFTSAWNWRLTVTKDGKSTVVTGKIPVSKIYFNMTGTATSLQSQTKYMMPGNANIYVQASTAKSTDVLTASCYEPKSRRIGTLSYALTGGKTLNANAYFTNTTVVRERGNHTWKINGSNVTYSILVIQ